MYQKCITNEQLKQKANRVESRLRAAILKQSKDKKFILLFFPFFEKPEKEKKSPKFEKDNFLEFVSVSLLPFPVLLCR